jgi:hypothetical protein
MSSHEIVDGFRALVFIGSTTKLEIPEHLLETFEDLMTMTKNVAEAASYRFG